MFVELICNFTPEKYRWSVHNQFYSRRLIVHSSLKSPYFPSLPCRSNVSRRYVHVYRYQFVSWLNTGDLPTLVFVAAEFFKWTAYNTFILFSSIRVHCTILNVQWKLSISVLDWKQTLIENLQNWLEYLIFYSILYALGWQIKKNNFKLHYLYV